MQHPFLFTIRAILFTLLRSKCYINVNLIHGEYFVVECIAGMKYITTFVVSKETEQKETNEKRKRK